MNDAELAERLREAGRGPAGAGVEFEAVRDRAASLRRRRYAASAAAASTLAIAGMAVVLGGLPGRSVAPGPDPAQPVSTSPLPCPREFVGPDPNWVPQTPTGVAALDRLVPDERPLSAVVCRYPAGPNSEPDRGGLPLAGSVVLREGLEALADELSWAPRATARERGCTEVGGPTTDYLLGLRYGSGLVWVAASSEPNGCRGASNGPFTTSRYLGERVEASFAAGRWVAAPASGRGWPCTAPVVGRRGEDRQLVPDQPSGVKVCVDGAASAVTGTRPQAVELAAAFTTLPARPTRFGRCSEETAAQTPSSYDLLFTYEEGPPVAVRVMPRCTPSVMGGELGADDATQVTAVLRTIVGATP